MNRQEIMRSANIQGLTFEGVKVYVSGANCDFAKVSVSDRTHPLFGWSSEYSWSAIKYATDTKGTLQ